MPPVLTLEQKAKLKKLNGMLSIKDIALLRYKDDEDSIKPYAYAIAEACLTGELDFIHGIRAHDLRWLYDHPETETILELPLDYETSPWPGSEAYSDIDSAWCLESEWTGDPHPKPAYKYNDNAAKLRRLYANNHNSAAYDFYRFNYAIGERCLIAHHVFKNWLISTGNFPLPDNCLLNNWFESEEQANKNQKSHNSSLIPLNNQESWTETNKPLKKLIPLQRETTEGLLLIYDICKQYDVQYLDQLPGNAAWGKIISGDYKSDSIKSINNGNKSITLSGGDKLLKSDFLDKYRKRFAE